MDFEQHSDFTTLYISLYDYPWSIKVYISFNNGSPHLDREMTDELEQELGEWAYNTNWNKKYIIPELVKNYLRHFDRIIVYYDGLIADFTGYKPQE